MLRIPKSPCVMLQRDFVAANLQLAYLYQASCKLAATLGCRLGHGHLGSQFLDSDLHAQTGTV